MDKLTSQTARRFSCRPLGRLIGVAVLTLAASLASQMSVAADRQTVAYIAPSLDISYWQWVAYGVKQRAKELGMDYVEFTSENSPAKQMDNVRTAMTRGVNAIVMGPVSSTSTPPVLRLLKSKSVPIAFTGIGPQAGQTDYTSAVTANNYETGKAQGSYVCKLAKERGGNKVAMLSLPQDRENAQKYMKGAQESFKADGCELVQVLETHGLTVNEAVAQANDILTAHPDVKAIYGMYDEAATGAAKALQTRGMTGKVAVVTADGSPTTIKLLRNGDIQGIFLQEAVGQGIDATTQVFNALNHKPTTQELALKEPLVTKGTIDQAEAQATVKRVYPPSAGNY
jgi:ribose transport system substrate-binding protein